MCAKSVSWVATPIDGDQLSLLSGLLSWMHLLGLEVLPAGKSSKYNFIYDRIHGTVLWRDELRTLLMFGRCRNLVSPLRSMGVAKCSACFRSVLCWYFCEMGVVCNHTCLMCDNPFFHAPHARTLKLLEVLLPMDKGGILSEPRTITVFNCLSCADE